MKKYEEQPIVEESAENLSSQEEQTEQEFIQKDLQDDLSNSEKLEELTRQVVSLRDALDAEKIKNKDLELRTQAEITNIRRRASQDVIKEKRFALEKFSKDLLENVFDNLDRALQHIKTIDDEKIDSLFEGVRITFDSFAKILTKYGIEEVSGLGEKFNPDFHEAITAIDSPENEPNTIVEVVKKGYKINGRMLRPAVVILAK